VRNLSNSLLVAVGIHSGKCARPGRAEPHEGRVYHNSLLKMDVQPDTGSAQGWQVVQKMLAD
jgi:hypothetical protein